MRGFGHLAIGLNIVSGVYNVVTTSDGLESCGREIAKQTGAVLGGYLAGTLGAVIVSTIVVFLSIVSGPVVMIVVGAAADSDFAEYAYELVGLDVFLINVDNELTEYIIQHFDAEEYITDGRFSTFSIPSPQNF